MSGQVVLTGDLNIVGRENVYTKLVAAPNSRHFYVDTTSLTVRWLNLTGGNVYSTISNTGGSISISSGKLFAYNCLFSKNTGHLGG